MIDLDPVRFIDVLIMIITARQTVDDTLRSQLTRLDSARDELERTSEMSDCMSPKTKGYIFQIRKELAASQTPTEDEDGAFGIADTTAAGSCKWKDRQLTKQNYAGGF